MKYIVRRINYYPDGEFKSYLDCRNASVWTTTPSEATRFDFTEEGVTAVLYLFSHQLAAPGEIKPPTYSAIGGDQI